MVRIVDKEKKKKWGVLCGTGMVEGFLTDTEVVESTYEEVFNKSEEICGNELSFVVELTPKNKQKLKRLSEEKGAEVPAKR